MRLFITVAGQADLAKETEKVFLPLFFRDLAVHNAIDRDAGPLYLFARGRNAQQAALVGARKTQRMATLSSSAISSSMRSSESGKAERKLSMTCRNALGPATTGE